MGFCSQCGNQVEEGMAFCSVCGAPQGAAPAAEPVQDMVAPTVAPMAVPEKKSGAGKVIAIIAALVLALAMIGVGAVLLLGGGKSGASKPEDAVKNFMEGASNLDMEVMLGSMIPDELLDGFFEAQGMTRKEGMQMMEMVMSFSDVDLDIKFRNFEVLEEERGDSDDIGDFIEDLGYELGVDVDYDKITDVREITFSYEYKEGDSDWEEDEESLCVYKYGNKWYVDPGEM